MKKLVRTCVEKANQMLGKIIKYFVPLDLFKGSASEITLLYFILIGVLGTSPRSMIYFSSKKSHKQIQLELL